MHCSYFEDEITEYNFAGDINELEIALDHANKANVEAQKVGYDQKSAFIHDGAIFSGNQALPRPDEGG